MRKWIRRVIIVVAVVAAVVALRLTVFAPEPVEVGVVAVARGRVESTVTNSKAGTVKARRRARLSPETGGRVVALPHREGARVAAGDVLLRLDDTSQRAELTRAERERTAAEARRRQACLAAELAQRELVRNRALAADLIISANLLDQLESRADVAAADCQAAAAAVASAQAAAAVLRAEIAKTVLRAPFAGVVAELTAEIGEWVTPSPPALPVPPVVEVIDPTSIYLSAPMDEVDSARIHAGQRVRATIDPYPGRSFPGAVTRVAPYVLDVEAQNRTVEIEVELDDEAFAATLLPGTSADVEIILEVHDDVLRVPTPTLLEGGAVLAVEDGVLTRRPVETGIRNWDFTEVLGGLTADDRVVTTLDRVEVKAGAEAVVREEKGAAGFSTTQGHP